MPSSNGRRKNALDCSFQSQIVLLQKSLADVNEVALKRAIDLWCLRLSQATAEEKHARNMLTVLMQNQLNEKGTLQKEFLRVANVRRNLNDLLQEINNDWQHFKIKLDSNNKPKTPRSAGGSFNKDDTKELQENARLKRELEQVKLQLEHCDLRVQELQVKYQRQQLSREPERKRALEKDQLLKLFIGLIGQFVHDNQQLKQKQGNGILVLNLFHGIFSQLENDGIGIAVKLKEFDQQLEKQLETFIIAEKSQLVRSLNLKLNNSTTKLVDELRSDYARQLAHLDWQSSTKLKLLKIKAYSKLRSVFLDLQKSKNVDLKALLQRFEFEFENLIKQLQLEF